MLKNIIILFALASGELVAQTGLGSLHGEVTDKSNSEVIPFAPVMLYIQDSSSLFNKSMTDLNGEFTFKDLRPGEYTAVVTYIGYEGSTVKHIKVRPDKQAEVKITMSVGEGVKLDEVVIQKEIVGYVVPCVRSVNTNNVTLTREDSYNTEEYSKINDNGFKNVTNDPLSTLSIDVDKASYSNVRRFISEGTRPPADAVRVEEMINYFTYNYPQPKGNVPFSISTEYTQCPWNKKHNLVHIGIQGKEIQTTNLPANNLVFLIDVSGSMWDQNKLPLVKQGLRLLVDQLRPQDEVSLLVYAGAAGVVLHPTSGAQKEKILEAIDKLEAGGSTAGGEGILLAYKTAKENFMTSGNNRIILATDGDFNVGVSSEGELVRLVEKKREEGVFLTVLGFGTGNYKDSKMEQLADKGNGNYAYIDDLLEAKKVLVKEMGATLLTIAKDVKIQVEFNPAKVTGYRLVGYENRLLNNEDFNDDKKDAGELGAGHTVTAIYEIIPAGSDEETASVDPLKYQSNQTPASTSSEVMTIKFRYKAPKENVSKLITEVLKDEKKSFVQASENCRFACAVAEFGMVLRNSDYKGEATYNHTMLLAKTAKGPDEEGYRAEFIRLVEKAALLK